MKDKKISIIISAYNTEKYIEKCLSSVRNQSYKNIEIIVINDNSKDNTWKIIQDIAKKDKRMIIKNNKENKGLSYNRNLGLELSTGDYIGYIDSDDYISVDYYEKMITRMQKEEADICVCDMKLVYEKNNTSTLITCGGKEKIDFINNGLAASCCNKLFKRTIMEKYKFSEGKVNEDLAVVFPALVNAKKIAYENSVAYNYVQRENSIQNSKITEKRFDIFYGVDLTIDRIKGCEKNKEITDGIVFQQLITLFMYVFCSEKNFFKRWKWFRIYAKKIKKYSIQSNIYYQEFLANSGKKHKIYYSLLLKLINYNLCFLAVLLSFIYDGLKILFKKNVIYKKIDLDKIEEAAKKQEKLLSSISISVVIPNYNYENFLLERIYSILNQTVKIDELIILDDCSSDNSQELIKAIYNRIKKYVNIKYIFNEKNSGSAFKQWKKGFESATKDYVWICEADDYCNKNLLKEVIRPIKQDNKIVISYVDTAFIDKDGNIIMRSIKPEIDIQRTGHWDADYINDGLKEINDYTFLNCTIANVSSAIFKRDNYQKSFEEAEKFRQAGDWLFYINMMSYGKIAFCNKALNYYRVHGNNITSTMKKQKHFEEIKNIHKIIEEKYGLSKKQKKEIEKRYQFLKDVWKIEI